MTNQFATAPNDGGLSQTREAFTRSSLVMVQPIPANGYVSIPIYGEAFYFLGATAPIEAKTDLTAYKPYRKGTGEEFPPEMRFSRIEIHNTNSFPVEIKIWAGFGKYIDNRVEVLDAYTRARGWSGDTIDAATTETFSGTGDGAEIQRKSFVVTNLDPNSRLDILDADDNFLCAVFPETSITLPISGTVKVKNSTGANIAAYVGEIYYIENGS